MLLPSTIPPPSPKLEARSITLEPSQIEWAKQFGDGNVSAAIRVAVQWFMEQAEGQEDD